MYYPGYLKDFLAAILPIAAMLAASATALAQGAPPYVPIAAGQARMDYTPPLLSQKPAMWTTRHLRLDTDAIPGAAGLYSELGEWTEILSVMKAQFAAAPKGAILNPLAFGSISDLPRYWLNLAPDHPIEEIDGALWDRLPKVTRQTWVVSFSYETKRPGATISSRYKCIGFDMHWRVATTEMQPDHIFRGVYCESYRKEPWSCGEIARIMQATKFRGGDGPPWANAKGTADCPG